VNPEHLYIHVPFCVRRCGYCDFAVTATSSAPVDAWLDSIRAELALRERAGQFIAPVRLDTIYVGGGTPSMLGTGAMERLAGVLREFATWDPATVEWTAEANPESFTPDLAADWAGAGINRLSLGAQSFDENVLRWMGRMHGADGPGRALHAARDAGLDNISIDLIFALPHRLERDWNADLQRAVDLDPTHVSLYGLTAEPATPLGRWVREGREVMTDEDTYAREYRRAVEVLSGAGYEHYEVSNFTRPGRDSRHNRAYWRHRPYIGLGPGAHSYLPTVRSWNVRDWAEYRRRLAEGLSAEDGRETLRDEDLSLERVWLGLRTDDGLEIPSLSSRQVEMGRSWVERGLARQERETLKLTHAGWLLLDRLAVDLASC
jgi:oxygen-independent coproporphyrinogen-3 oxidase